MAKSSLEVSIAQTKLDLSKAEVKLSEAKRAVPYSIQEELNAYKEVTALKKGLEYAEKVLLERF